MFTTVDGSTDINLKNLNEQNVDSLEKQLENTEIIISINTPEEIFKMKEVFLKCHRNVHVLYIFLNESLSTCLETILDALISDNVAVSKSSFAYLVYLFVLS